MLGKGLNKGKYSKEEHAKDYVKYRPVYPKQIFEIIMEYVYEQSTLAIPTRLPIAVDIGCGPGLQSTVHLSSYFDKVVGIDICEGQISQAKKLNRHPNLEFRVSPAEEIPVAIKSVNLVMAATSLHWLDVPRFYKECDRVLAPGGVIAAFGYGPWHVINHPNITAINRVVSEIWNTVGIDDNPHYDWRNNHIIDLYRSESLQIPYRDRKRVDGISAAVETTLEKFAALFKSISFCRDYIAASKEHEVWWESCVERLVAACGAASPDETSLTYQIDIFMLLRRKPL